LKLINAVSVPEKNADSNIQRAKKPKRTGSEMSPTL
jgi:hypothetical protein